jgi:hypothetical protein
MLGLLKALLSLESGGGMAMCTLRQELGLFPSGQALNMALAFVMGLAD